MTTIVIIIIGCAGAAVYWRWHQRHELERLIRRRQVRLSSLLTAHFPDAHLPRDFSRPHGDVEQSVRRACADIVSLHTCERDYMTLRQLPRFREAYGLLLKAVETPDADEAKACVCECGEVIHELELALL